MANIEKYENLVLGSGDAGKFIAWTMTGAGRRTAMVERWLLGGACPNVACLPSKNIVYSAKVVSLARRGAEFGLKTESLSVDMKSVQRRKRLMVEGLHQMHVDHTVASGAELIRATPDSSLHARLKSTSTAVAQGPFAATASSSISVPARRFPKCQDSPRRSR